MVSEVCQGLRREKDRRRVAEDFRLMTFLEPSGIDAYLRVADVYRKLRERGTTVRSTIDCVIAVIAEEGGCALLARDRDRQAIVASGLLRVTAWPSGSSGASG